MGIILRFFPNGEFTKGVSATKRRDKRADRLKAVPPDMIPVGSFRSLRWQGRDVCVSDRMVAVEPGDEFLDCNHTIYTYLCNDFGTQTYAFECRDGRVGTLALEDTLQRHITLQELSPIGLSDARILKEPVHSRKRCERMTSSMARNIRNAAYLMSREYGKDCLSFLTLTLPGLSPDDLSEVCANWDKVVHRFFMWLRQVLNKKHIEPSFVYCTEIQTKRLQIRHEYAPHLHIIFRGRNGKKHPWAITPKMAKAAWIRSIKPCVAGSIDDRAVENLQRVKHDAGRYLSKYMSKGKNSLPPIHERTSDVASLKTHWGGMSRNLSKRIREGTTRLAEDGNRRHLATMFYAALPYLLKRGYVRYYSESVIAVSRSDCDDGARGIKVGVGCLEQPLFEGGLADCLRLANVMYGFEVYELM